MNVLIGCEFSGIVRDAFRAKGHDAWSCDIVNYPEFDNEFHVTGDVLSLIYDRHWDLAIFHPPCTHLATSGARWFKEKRHEQAQALLFVCKLFHAPIDRICLENPISIISTHVRKPDQIIQPWQFGHGETKATCLWLKNLPLLTPTNIVAGRANRIHKMPPSPDRAKMRSITFSGIAQAMAEQWGGVADNVEAA